MEHRRVLLMVLDSFGAGALPDAPAYGDAGAHTLLHICEQAGGLRIPYMERLGLGNAAQIPCLAPARAPLGAYGKAAERSAGKDTTVGHWEIAGLISEQPLPTYPNGFPPALMQDFERAIGRGTLGNKTASGTAIIEELGARHMETGFPIVYTSADSVFQIAAHEEIVPIETLYGYCKTARAILLGEHGVGRVIARPFTGRPGAFQRTANRHDFSLQPPGRTLLDAVSEHGLDCAGVGKISDIFAGRGLTDSISISGNMDGVDKMFAMMERHSQGLIFVNLVDFDMKYGHRRDPKGYAEALEAFDARIPEIFERMRAGDLLILTADHGCDPTHAGTDHTREYVPILLYGKSVTAGRDIGVRDTFADIGETALAHLGCAGLGTGTIIALS